MSASKNICLLGFSQEADSKLKEIIAASATHITFNWVAANDKSLSGAVINASFLEAPQIQKYISMVNKPIVCAHGNAEAGAAAAAKGLHSINWTEETDRTVWISALLGKEPAKPMVSPQPQVASAAVSKASPSSLAPQKKPVPAAENLTQISDKAIKDNNGDILNRIVKGESVVLYAVNGNSATWVKPAEGIVFINYPREHVPGYDEWIWEEVSPDSIPASARQLKLDLWSFETLWQSQLDGKKYIDTNAHFRLIRWPQPLSRHGRTEALRLAACAQGYPVNVATLNEKTNYPVERIHRFLFATMIAGQTEQVKGAITDPKPARPQMDEEKKAEKRSLLARFRDKLGL